MTSRFLSCCGGLASDPPDHVWGCRKERWCPNCVDGLPELCAVPRDVLRPHPGCGLIAGVYACDGTFTARARIQSRQEFLEHSVLIALSSRNDTVTDELLGRLLEMDPYRGNMWVQAVEVGRALNHERLAS